MSRKSFAASLKDWDPRDHADWGKEQHFERLTSVGTYGSNTFYMNPIVTAGAAICIWGFVIWAMVGKGATGEATELAQGWVTDIWNWMYMISQNIWIVVLMYIMVKYWDLKLGKDDEKQEYDDMTWFAMLFSCGVATGLWYFTAEAMWHYEGYGNPRWMDKDMFNDSTRAEHSLMVALFHWGPHGWIPYSLVGAVIALLAYRRDFPMSMRFAVYPIIGELCYGPIGDALEILSICCTIFGVCTSLGLGARQIAQGLKRLDVGMYHGTAAVPEGRLGVEVTQLLTTAIIVVITACATMSVVIGLKAGIAFLARLAFVLSFFILLAILFLDETWYIMNALTSAVGYYLWYLPKISFHTDAWEELAALPMFMNSAKHPGGQPTGNQYMGMSPDIMNCEEVSGGKKFDGFGAGAARCGGKADWMNTWTIFYWGWWISWGPFCGLFLARISRGRTLGSYIMGSLIVPSVWSFLFMGVFGAAQMRISNAAVNFGLGNNGVSAYGALAFLMENGTSTGVKPFLPIAMTGTVDGATSTWQENFPVPDSVTRLYMLATEDVIFEHLSCYGGPGWTSFITVTTLVCIFLYFITSSDSASFVVDMLAANGVEEPPMPQKVFWCVTEGAAAIALLWAADGSTPDAALKAVKPLPIILGLPFTFVLFWVCQSALIICREETKQISIRRKNFTVFIFNFEPMSYIALFCPFFAFAPVAEKIWKGSKYKWMFYYGFCWVVMIVFFCLGALDIAFAYVGVSVYFNIALGTAALRASTRQALGISGDFISDCICCCFAFPFALGQLHYQEDWSSWSEKAKMEVEPIIMGVGTL